MNLQENIQRIKEMMGLLTEDQKNYENQPIVLVGPAGAGKSTTAKLVAEKLNIPYIDVDERQGSEEYEKLCKKEPGVQVNIIRTPDGHTQGTSNLQYKRCVLSKLLEKYGNSKVVLDIGAGTEVSSDLLENLPNLFVFGVPPTSDNDKPYVDFLKKVRIDRAVKIGNKKLEDQEKNLDTKDIQLSIDAIREFYRGKQMISILNEDGKQKTKEELADEIIFKLT
jgi:hypothetical protein